MRESREVCQTCHSGNSGVRSTGTMWLWALCLLWGSLSACPSADDPPPTDEVACASGEVRVGGICRESCQTNADCPAGRFCNSGACIPEMTCQEDADCQAVFNDPRAVCREGGCFILQCSEGEEQPCQTLCGNGTEYCRGGVWRGCTAPMPRLEICGDGQDNDCNGRADEGCGDCEDGDERACETECGTGVERCLGGWRGCTAERPQPFDVCGDGVDNDCNGQIDDACDNCEGQPPRECATACGTGTETCVDNTWTGCTAPPVGDEVCDGRDNDCDGDVDEEIVRSCANACGSGIEQCDGGQWGGCTAPSDCACADGDVDQQVCGTCGFRERACDDRAWGPWGACSEAGQCEPGEEETQDCGACGVDRRICTAECQWGDWQGCKSEGVCAAGVTQEESCGTCGGTRVRVCAEACQWEEWGACSVPPGSQCAPGDSETRDCERCGSQTRTCLDSCEWGQWSLCEGQGLCEPGEEEGRTCGGQCEVQLRSCNDSCQWDDWGACTGGGQCSPGETEQGSCGACGTRSRSCGPECIWGSWSSCAGEGVCSPGDREDEVCGQSDVGACSYGMRTRTCDGQCEWTGWGACFGNVDPSTDTCGDGIDQDCDGMDDRRPDQYEPNDSCAAAFELEQDPDERVLVATIDTAADQSDYFKFYADDTSFNLGREVIRLTLEDVPSDADYDLYLYRGLESCNRNEPLERATTGSYGDDELLEWYEALNFDDSGVFYIRVRRYAGNACFSPYRLTVYGLR